MFEAGGFGVAVTVAVTVAPAVPFDPEAWGPVPAGVTRRRSRLTDVLDVHGFGEPEFVRELTAIGDLRSQLAAYEAAVVAGFAARRPAGLDRRSDEPGHRVAGWTPGEVPGGVSEFFADELALVAGISPQAASALTERSLVWVHQLPDTWAALADGLIDPARATAIAQALGGQSVEAGGRVDPAVVGEVEAQALEWAVAGETPRRLQDRVAAALIAVDAAAADRRRKKAERNADVTARATGDGMGQLIGDLPMPVAVACRESVDEYARLLKAAGDDRPINLLRALVLADLVLRPWDTSRPPVTAHLQVIAPLPVLRDATTDATSGAAGAGGVGAYRVPADADAATVDGAPITPGQLRELLEQLDALCPGGLQAPAGGSLGINLTDPQTGALRATVTRAELERLVRRGCPQHPATGTGSRRRRRRNRQQKSGEPPTDSGGPGGQDSDAPPADCGCGVLGAPPPVDRYEPTPAQHRHVKARDRTCRHPGCRRPAAWTDRDHVCPRAQGGETACENLCCLCRRHHRLKTHARGWRFTMTADGVLSVTTPSGVTRTTRPPGLRLPADLLLVGNLNGDSAPPDPADDPPPF